MAGLLDVPGKVWKLARTVEDIVESQQKTRDALSILGNRLAKLEDRMTRLEVGQDRLITEARAAAGIAATGLASAIISDTVTRITRLEERSTKLHGQHISSIEGPIATG